MPNKPIKAGFKVWSCCCSCCGYLCTFQVYEGKPIDPKYMGGVDCLSQVRKTYGFDRKSKRYWIRPFFSVFH